MKYSKKILPALMIIAVCGVYYGITAVKVPMTSVLKVRNRVSSSCMKVYNRYLETVRRGYGIIHDKVRHGPRWKREELRKYIEIEKKGARGGEQLLKTGELLISAPVIRLDVPERNGPVPSYSQDNDRLLREGTEIQYVRIFHGSRNLSQIALSFDSGTIGNNIMLHNQLINVLIRTRTPATFFLTGKFIETYPEIAKRISKISFFELGNHSYHHPDLTRLSLGRIRAELIHTQRVLKKVTGIEGTLFRPPYGSVNRRVVMTAALLGLHTVLWDVDSRDYHPSVKAAKIKKNILQDARNGSIVIMHMHGERADTVVALETVIDILRHRGHELVTVSTLMAGLSSMKKENGHEHMSVEQDKEKVVYGLGY